MKKFLIIFAMLMIISVECNAADKSVSLPLTEAIRLAVSNNLEVRAELYNPALLEADLNRSKSIYDTVLTLQSNYTDSSSAFTAPTGQSLLLDSSLSQLLWTGGTATLSYNNTKLVSPVNRWQSALGVSVSQPLLKNAGRDATEAAIRIFRSTKFASLERFNTKLLNTIAQVRTEYFKLYSLREEREVKKVSLALAKKILYETQSRVKAGVLPAMENLNAEYGVVTRERELIDAEKAVSDQVDVVCTLLQLPSGSEVITADSPGRKPVIPDNDDAIQKAMGRSDIRELKRTLEGAELDAKNNFQKNRPDLLLTASTQTTGTDRYYQHNLDKFMTYDNPVWSVGLKLVYPFGNSTAENDYKRSRLKVEQLSLQIRSLEENAANSVRSAIRGVLSGYKQIEVSDRGVAFAEERLKAFTRKLEVGLATIKDVLDVENDLALSKSSQIKSVVAYENALTLFWQSTGELLDQASVRVVEGEADRLYSTVK